MKYKLGDICEIVSGSTPKTSVEEYWDGDIKWITPAELSDESYIINDSVRKITDLGVKKTGLTPFPAGTVILSSRAPIGLMAIAANEVCTNQGFKSIVLKDDNVCEYLYMALLNEKDIIAGEGSGSTFDEISAQTFKNYTITLPSNEVILVFHKQVELIFHALYLKQQENKKLTELQSLLLAKIGK